eukprot:1274530-Rhodomonas_salina.3
MGRLVQTLICLYQPPHVRDCHIALPPLAAVNRTKKRWKSKAWIENAPFQHKRRDAVLHARHRYQLTAFCTKYKYTNPKSLKCSRCCQSVLASAVCGLGRAMLLRRLCCNTPTPCSLTQPCCAVLLLTAPVSSPGSRCLPRTCGTRASASLHARRGGGNVIAPSAVGVVGDEDQVAVAHLHLEPLHPLPRPRCPRQPPCAAARSTRMGRGRHLGSDVDGVRLALALPRRDHHHRAAPPPGSSHTRHSAGGLGGLGRRERGGRGRERGQSEDLEAARRRGRRNMCSPTTTGRLSTSCARVGSATSRGAESGGACEAASEVG